jgi:predicted homoserine dehydrogenase-like protein
MAHIVASRLAAFGRPVRVAVVGTGWFGGGTVREMLAVHAHLITPAFILGRSAARLAAAAALPQERVQIIDFNSAPESMGDLAKAAAERTDPASTTAMITIAAASDETVLMQALRAVCLARAVDVVFEASSDTSFSLRVCLTAIECSMPILTASSELAATVGLLLTKYAVKQNCAFGVCDGDQPGCVSKLVQEVRLLGFRPRVVGNCKGFLNIHQTVEQVRPHVLPGHNIAKNLAYADGTKQSLELVTMANSFDLDVLQRGCCGPSCTKADLVATFSALMPAGQAFGPHCSSANPPCYVDYVLGINGVDQGAGVFVIADRATAVDEDKVISDLKYLKKGPGPGYLFFRDHHLCYFEAVSSLLEMALLGVPTLVPRLTVAEAITVAKTPLSKGTRIPPMGCDEVYALAESSARAVADKILPFCLSEFATLRVDVPLADTPITYDMVDLDETALLVQMRRRQDRQEWL